MSILKYLREGLSKFPKHQEYVSVADDAYDVYKIAKYAEDIKPEETPIHTLKKQLQKNMWLYPDTDDGEEISISDVMANPEKYKSHYDRILKADTSHPIIMAPDGEIIDGNHRLGKAVLDGDRTIWIKKVPEWEDIEFAMKRDDNEKI